MGKYTQKDAKRHKKTQKDAYKVDRFDGMHPVA